MKIRNKKRILACLLFGCIALSATSCGSVSALIRDPDFQEGFRAGWNATAPEEYRY